MKPLAAARRHTVSRRRLHPSRPRLEIMEDRTLLSTITVTSAGDAIDPLDGVVTLREAITAANTNAASGDAPAGSVGFDTIAFDIPGAGVHTITLTAALPDLTEPVVIDGTTQPGSSANTLAVGDDAVLKIEISGADIASNLTAFQIQTGASGSTIRGLVINRFTALGSAAVKIFNSSNNTIVGNFLGTDPTGTIALGNNIGVDIRGENNRIGSAAPADRNLIAGNNKGISLTNTGSVLNTVQGNYIGVGASGKVDLGNANVGVLIRGVLNGLTQGGALIGGSTSAPGAEAGNVISGNDGLAGIEFDNGANTVLGPVTIQGNIIGLGADGSTVVGNAGPGIVALTDLGSTNGMVMIGGLGASTRNVISGNHAGGIVYSDAAAIVQGNYIGTDVTGRLNRGNIGYGVAILGDRRDPHNPAATTMTIGGTDYGAANLISGNTMGGISIRNANAVIQGNWIGTQVNGNLALGNSGEGIKVFNVVANPFLQVMIGGHQGAGNIIAYNGVGVSASEPAVSILGNSIFGNARLGIDLSSNALAAAPAPPVITETTETTVSGTFSGTNNSVYHLEFFSNPIEVNQGKDFLGATDLSTDEAGNGHFTVALRPFTPSNEPIIATASNVQGTSEFSQAVVMPGRVSNIETIVTGTPNPVQAGDEATFTFTVTNTGPDDVTDGPHPMQVVRFITAVPEHTTLVSFQAAAGWWTTSHPVIGGIDYITTSMFVGEPAIFTMVVRVNPETADGTTITATSIVTPSPSSASVTVMNATPPVESVADLAVAMSVPDGPLTAGTNFTYTIGAWNMGPAPATGVVAVNVLPAGLNFISSTQGTYDPATRTLTANLGDMASGTSTAFSIVVQADAPGIFTNVANIQGAQTDPNSANDTASRTDTVTSTPPIVVGPQVVAVVRNGVHWQPTSIVLAFSTAMDPASAQNVANYRIEAPGRRLVAIRSATYNAAGRSVTIRPVHQLNIHHPFTLAINGRSPDGLTDASGNLLDGAGNGESGTDYQANVVWYGVQTRVTPVHPRPRGTPPRTPVRPIHRAPPSIHAAPRFASVVRTPKWA